MTEVFAFDVTVSTHGLLQAGMCEARMLNGHNHHRVVVAADSYFDAFLTAAQMAGSADVRQLHGRPIKGYGSEQESVMVTGVYPRY